MALLKCSSGVQSEHALFKKKQSSVGILATYHLIHYIKVSGGCLAFIAVILEWLTHPEYFYQLIPECPYFFFFFVIQEQRMYCLIQFLFCCAFILRYEIKIQHH